MKPSLFHQSFHCLRVVFHVRACRLGLLCLGLGALSTGSFHSAVWAQEPARQRIVPVGTTKEAATDASKTASEEAPKTEPASNSAARFPYRPMTSWIGQRFLFLPAPKSLGNGQYDDFSGGLKRRDYAGRTLKVVNVSDFSGRVHVEFEVEGDGAHLRARTLPNKESLKGLLLVADLEAARAQWQGQTLWCKQQMLSTYNEATDELGSLTIKKYAPVKVVAIEPGWDEEKPLRFLLECADGRHGFIDVNLSGTNVPQELRELSRFESYFLTENPRLLHRWPASIWTAIENNRVLGGMTVEQVQLSWGTPTRTTRTAAGEQWHYPAGILTFKNGVVVNIQ